MCYFISKSQREIGKVQTLLQNLLNILLRPVAEKSFSFSKYINCFSALELYHFYVSFFFQQIKTISNFKPKMRVYIELFVVCLIVGGAQQCDIWKASDCTGAPTNAEEEIMKSDDYTTEQLYKYCDKGKSYVDCVNAKLKCCDLRTELKASLPAYEKQLQRVAWKLGPYCAGLGKTCFTFVRLRDYGQIKIIFELVFISCSVGSQRIFLVSKFNFFLNVIKCALYER